MFPCAHLRKSGRFAVCAPKKSINKKTINYKNVVRRDLTSGIARYLGMVSGGLIKGSVKPKIGEIYEGIQCIPGSSDLFAGGNLSGVFVFPL
jgi:hypothetical protein